MNQILRASIYVIVLGAAAGGVYVATRDQPAPEAAPAGHDHSAMAAQGGGTPALDQPIAISEADARRIGITYATVTRGSLDKEIRTIAAITFDEARVQTVTTRLEGWVEQLLVNTTGQLVAAGEPLVTIYSPMFMAAQEELLLARRLQTDVAAADSGARQRAAELLVSARRRLSVLGITDSEIAEIERAGVVRRATTIRSPAAGYVIDKNVLAGAKIMAGEVLYKMADLTTVWAEAEVFEQNLASVRLDQRVQAEFEAWPGEHRTGRVSYIYPTLNADTRTAKVRVVLTNSDLKLKPGMYATIRISVPMRSDVLSLPRSAVLSTGERNIVFLREDEGRFKPREVELGASNDERVEILSGLKSGDVVVSSATFLVDAESNLRSALGGMTDTSKGAPPKTKKQD